MVVKRIELMDIICMMLSMKGNLIGFKEELSSPPYYNHHSNIELITEPFNM